jgi:hypothetical protein
MVTQSTISSIINFDYQVVIINITIISYKHSDIALLLNDSSEQASPISEDVVEIRINIYLTREIIWQHDTREPHRYHEWPHFALTIKELSRTHRTLVPSSMRKPHRVIRGWPEHYSNVIRDKDE